MGGSVNVTSLDDFAATSLPRGAKLLYVKVDVEGGELEVLEGMRRLLRSGRVALASFEYAKGWHPLFRTRGRGLNESERLSTRPRSLHAFQEKASRFGYETYLIAVDRHAGVVLVPVHDFFWHDELEICADRRAFYGSWDQWCWNDLLVVPRCDRCVKAVLFDEILPAIAMDRKEARRNGVRRRPLPECECEHY